MKAPVNLQHPFGPLLHFYQVEGLGQVHEVDTGTMISDADFPVQFSNNIYTHKKTWKQFIKKKQVGRYDVIVKVNQITSWVVTISFPVIILMLLLEMKDLTLRFLIRPTGSFIII
ncbi:hypothetical protein V8G54_026783 [Vigna mungo]|uniref:Uncharacterized protein n=1 Tax=Vigna mungo TaxID=3915 RepID=A0AAQ3RMG3_VIGMU